MSHHYFLLSIKFVKKFNFLSEQKSHPRDNIKGYNKYSKLFYKKMFRYLSSYYFYKKNNKNFISISI